MRIDFQKVYASKSYYDDDGKQWLLQFGNDYQLSIICHRGSMGWSEGLFEIGVFGDCDSMVELPGITAAGDTVKGFLTPTAVSCVILKMQFLTDSAPVSVFGYLN
jgi:hypothetical protein